MKPRLKSSPAARDLIKRFEAFRDTAERGPDGRWVVGYGHRAAARAGIKVSEEEASLLLVYDIMQAEAAIDELTAKPLARAQRDALISFVHDVGVEAFRNSDIARCLFEGRMEAAGESLAAYGDGTNPRREAEATMFLDALLPATGRSQSVELVIKVEHPSEERVLEGAIAGSGARDREPVEDYVPPPPMPDRAIASRREAEAEIARILATVEAMPLEEREALARDDGETAFAPMENVVADLSDAPVEGLYEAVEETVEDSPAADVEADAAAEMPGEAGTTSSAEEVETGAVAEDDSAEARVAARMAQEIEPAVEDVAAEPEPAAAGVAPAGEGALAALRAGFDLPAGMDLGFVLTRGPAEEPAAETVAPATEADTAPAAPQPAAPRDVYSLDLPEGSTLGYVFSSIMTGRFEPRPDAVPASRPAETPAADVAPADAVTAEAETEASPEVREDVAIGDIVERAVAVAGDDTPPPHPAELPAESAGAVGEVEAEEDEAGSPAPTVAIEDDPLMDGEDPLVGADEFSPQDLAADLHIAPEKSLPARSDDGGWGFLASFTAGAVVTAFGLISTWGEWEFMWAERSLSGDGWILVAGVFLMLVSAWFLGSVWLERLKRNGRDTAKVQ